MLFFLAFGNFQAFKLYSSMCYWIFNLFCENLEYMCTVQELKIPLKLISTETDK